MRRMQKGSFPKNYNDSFWMKTTNHRKYLDSLGKKLNIKEINDWYSISMTRINKEGGSVFFQTHYENSLWKALQSVYPESEWQPWKDEKQVPLGFWKDKINQRRYFDWLGK